MIKLDARRLSATLKIAEMQLRNEAEQKKRKEFHTGFYSCLATGDVTTGDHRTV